MLVRKQVLLEESQVLELEELIALCRISFSEAVRQGVRMVVDKIKTGKTKKEKMDGAEFLLSQAKKAVAGPGDSDYDKYAYEF